MLDRLSASVFFTRVQGWIIDKIKCHDFSSEGSLGIHFCQEERLLKGRYNGVATVQRAGRVSQTFLLYDIGCLKRFLIWCRVFQMSLYMILGVSNVFVIWCRVSQRESIYVLGCLKWLCDMIQGVSNIFVWYNIGWLKCLYDMIIGCFRCLCHMI